MTDEVLEKKYPWHVGRMLTAWGVSAVFGVLVLFVLDGHERFQWLALAIGVSALVTFALQLGTAQREGFIVRTSVSVAGSVAIILVLQLIGLAL